jgi:hypothetical protein
VKQISKLIAAATTALLSVIVWGGAAWAQTTTVPDPTGGAVLQTATDGKAWVSTYGMAALFVLALLGLIIALALKLMRKARATL